MHLAGSKHCRLRYLLILFVRLARIAEHPTFFMYSGISGKSLKNGHYGIYGKMVEAVTKIDKAGRVVIPKEVREKVGLKEDETLLVADATDDILILKKLDVKELAKRLRSELKGINVEGIAKRIEEESNEQARKEYAALRG